MRTDPSAAPPTALGGHNTALPTPTPAQWLAAPRRRGKPPATLHNFDLICAGALGGSPKVHNASVVPAHRLYTTLDVRALFTTTGRCLVASTLLSPPSYGRSSSLVAVTAPPQPAEGVGFEPTETRVSRLFKCDPDRPLSTTECA